MFFFKIWPTFNEAENLLPLVVIKDMFKIYFHEMENLLPVVRIFEEVE